MTNKKENIDNRKHGSVSTYMKYKCRCVQCSKAARAYYDKKNESRNARRAKARIYRISAQKLVDFISESQPEVYEKYKNKLGSWNSNGIDVWTADRICIELHTHPILVFGQEWIVNALQEKESVDA